MPTVTTPTADTRQAITFFKMLYGEKIPDDSAIELRVKSAGMVRRKFLRSFDDLNLGEFDPLAHVWYGVALRKAESNRGTLGDLTLCPVVWSDCDELTPAERDDAVKRLLAFRYPPSIIVNSGGGLHVLWTLVKPLDMRIPEQAELLREIVYGLALHFQDIKADPNVHDPSRVLAVPGTWNVGNGRTKIYDPPRQVTILYADESLKWSAENEFSQFRKPVHTATTPAVVVSSVSTKVPSAPLKLKVNKRWQNFIKQGWSDGCGYKSHSELDAAVLLTLHMAGHTDAEILGVFSDPANAIGKKFRDKGADGPRYLDLTLMKAKEWVEQAQGNTSTLKLENGAMKAYRPRGNVWETVYTKPIVPLARLRGSTNSWLVKAAGEPPINLDSVALSSANNLKRALPPIGAWTGSDKDAQALITYFEQQKVPERTSVGVIGWHGQHVVFPNAVLGPNGVEEGSPYTYTGQYRSSKLNVIEDWTTLARQVGSLLLQLHGPGAIHVIAGWFLATSFAPQIRALTSQGFPLLNVWGSTGSGKTTLLSLLWRMTGSTREPISIQGATDFTRTIDLSSTNTLPMIFDEHRAGRGLIRFYTTLREVYQQEEHERGRPDLTVVRLTLTSPVAVAGESALPDPALRQRALIVKLSHDVLGCANPPSLMRQAKIAFEALPLQDFNGGFYQHCRNEDIPALWREEADRAARLIPQGSDERKQFGPIVALVGLRLFEDFLPAFQADEAARAIASVLNDEEEPSLIEAIIVAIFTLLQHRELRIDQDVKLDGSSLFVNPSLVLPKLTSHLERERSELPTSKDALREALRVEHEQKAGQGIVRGMRVGKRLGGQSEKVIELNLDAIEAVLDITKEQWRAATLDPTRHWE